MDALHSLGSESSIVGVQAIGQAKITSLLWQQSLKLPSHIPRISQGISPGRQYASSNHKGVNSVDRFGLFEEVVITGVSPFGAAMFVNMVSSPG